MSSLSLLALVGALWAATPSAQAVGVPGQGTWETTLQARDINGDSVVDAYYDTALDITWLADWNANGEMNWNTATAWSAGLDVHGVTGWRLPRTTDTGPRGCDFSFAGTDCGYNVDPASSEMAHMFYVTLGNKAICPPGGDTASCAGAPQPGWGLTNTADFVNLRPSIYWSGTESIAIANAWLFNSSTGVQNALDKRFDSFNAVAVRAGDVAAVPEPQAWAMLLLGLGAGAVAVRWRAH